MAMNKPEPAAPPLPVRSLEEKARLLIDEASEALDQGISPHVVVEFIGRNLLTACQWLDRVKRTRPR